MAVQPVRGIKKSTGKRAASQGSATFALVSGKPALAKSDRRNADIDRAMAKLTEEGKVSGARSVKISVRVDPGVFAAAAEELRLPETDVSAVVNASLAVVAAPDRFKAWWKDPGNPLPDDFELAI